MESNVRRKMSCRMRILLATKSEREGLCAIKTASNKKKDVRMQLNKRNQLLSMTSLVRSKLRKGCDIEGRKKTKE